MSVKRQGWASSPPRSRKMAMRGLVGLLAFGLLFPSGAALATTAEPVVDDGGVVAAEAAKTGAPDVAGLLDDVGDLEETPSVEASAESTEAAADSQESDVPVVQNYTDNGTIEGLDEEPTADVSSGVEEGLSSPAGLIAPQAVIGDDYPARYKNAGLDAVVDEWNFYNRECTSFVAWRLNSANGIRFTNQYAGQARWGNAIQWGDAARRAGIPVNSTPAVGAVAWSNAGTYGHVAWVAAVSGSTVTVEEYNYSYDGRYHLRTVPASSFAGYIHIKDLATNRDPRGTLDVAQGGIGTFSVRGWAFDPDAPTSPLGIHVYVGGPPGSGAEGYAPGTTSSPRPDVAAAYPGVGPNQGFDFSITTSKRGRQTIYVYAINQPSGNNPLIGTAEVTIGNPNPLGYLDLVASPEAGKIRVAGWAFDPNKPKVPVRIHVYVGGPAGSGEGHDLGEAKVYRDDVPRQYPETSPNQGFNVTFDTKKTGRQNVYVYALNVNGTPGENVQIGSSAVTVETIKNFPSVPVPTISGIARVGQILMAKPGSWLDGTTLGYQWYADGQAVAGATQTSYTLPASMLNKAMSIKVTGSKAGYSTASSTSLNTGPVGVGELTAPTIKISGDVIVGSTLKAETGAWTPKPSQFSYRWQRDGASISGATAENYTVMPADAGKKITVEVTGNLAGYETKTVTSAAVTISVPVDPEPVQGGDHMVLRSGNLYSFRYSLSSGPYDREVYYGRANDVTFFGDWDGDGVDGIAVRRGNSYFFKDVIGLGAADREITYGRADDVVLVGDWDGDGKDTLAVRRGNTFYFKNSIDSGAADREITYGRADDVVLVGDWDGDGTDTLAVRRGNQYFFKNVVASGNADQETSFGKDTDEVLIGDWNKDEVDTPAVRRGATFFVSNDFKGGNAAISFDLGNGSETVYAAKLK